MRVKLRNSGDNYVAVPSCCGMIKAHESCIIRIGTPASALAVHYVHICYFRVEHFLKLHIILASQCYSFSLSIPPPSPLPSSFSMYNYFFTYS